METIIDLAAISLAVILAFCATGSIILALLSGAACAAYGCYNFHQGITVLKKT
jgi:hypothetical protein